MRVAVQPALTRFRRRDHRMAARPRVLAGVPVGGVIAALGRAALLTGTQVDPPRTDLHALLALAALRVPDGGNRGDVNTRLGGHGLVRSDVAAPRVFHREPILRAGFEGLGGTCSSNNGAQVPRVPGRSRTSS